MKKQDRPNRKLKKRGLVFVISGPSGSGKTTLLNKALKSPKLKHKLIKSVSVTTRPRRTGERHGRDYFFFTQRRFKQWLRRKKILEWTRYLGYYYATRKDFVETHLIKGKNLILCLDLRGALAIKRLYPGNTITIFVLPPSLTDLHQRIERRCARTGKDEIKERLKLARQELRNRSKYDYCLVNKELDKTTLQLKDIILKKI